MVIPFYFSEITPIFILINEYLLGPTRCLDNIESLRGQKDIQEGHYNLKFSWENDI